MLVSIKLENNLSCEYICKTIQKALTLYSKENNINDSILVIDIRNITDDTSMIPKLEFKDSLT